MLDKPRLIGGSVVQVVRRLLHGPHPLGTPHQESCRRCSHSAYEPDQLFHTLPPLPKHYPIEPTELQCWTHKPRYCLWSACLPEEGEAAARTRRRGAGCRYTGSIMDRVRFGRALGYGARHAAKTLLQAADAASTPGPGGTGSASAPAGTPNPGTPNPGQTQAARVAKQVVQAQQTVATTKKHAGKLGRSVWTPLARFSSVVWLQVTGLFFALIAMFLAQGAWNERGAWRLPLGSHAATKFYVLAVAFATFAYFAVSNFVRAHRRDRA